MARGKRIELTERQKQELKAAYGHELNAFLRIRIRCLLRIAEGETAQELAPKLGLHVETIRLWARNYRREGLVGLKLKPGRGKPKTVSAGQVEKIKEWIRAGRVRTLEEAQEMVSRNFQRTYTKTGIWRLFKSIGISYDAGRGGWSIDKAR
jgi:transposase